MKKNKKCAMCGKHEVHYDLLEIINNNLPSDEKLFDLSEFFKNTKISEQRIQNKYHAHAEDSGTKKELEYLRKGKTM